MDSFTTDAINIKTYPLSENDNIVVMFSKERGLIKGVAKGVKRPKSKLGARMQALVCNNLMVSCGRNLGIIKEASAINPFNKLRSNLDKLTNAIYIVETINNFCKDETQFQEAQIFNAGQNEIIYKLLYDTLNNIQNSESKEKITLSVLKFQLHFMENMGFGIELERCLKCSKKIEGDALFSPLTGGVTCTSCNSGQIKLHKKVREFLIALKTTPVCDKTQYDDLINEKIVNSCFNLVKKYIEIIANKKSKTFKVMEATKVS